jgi:hypothetical protein
MKPVSVGDRGELAERRRQNAAHVHGVCFFRGQNGVRGSGAERRTREHRVSVLDGEVQHELVERDDDLNGEQVDRAVVGHHEQQ